MTPRGDGAVKTMAATEAQGAFGRLLDEAQREPVMIQKKGRPVAMVLSMADYERLEALEDAYWGRKAEEAAKGGFLSEEETQQLFQSILNAQD